MMVTLVMLVTLVPAVGVQLAVVEYLELLKSYLVLVVVIDQLVLDDFLADTLVLQLALECSLSLVEDLAVWKLLE